MKHHIDRLAKIQEMITDCQRRIDFYGNERHCYPDDLKITQKVEQSYATYNLILLRLASARNRVIRDLNSMINDEARWVFIIAGKEQMVTSDKAAKKLAAKYPDAAVKVYDKDGYSCTEIAEDIF
jgi:hypothetical protein